MSNRLTRYASSLLGGFRAPDFSGVAHADRPAAPRGVAELGNENAQPIEVGRGRVVVEG